jgi:trehalose-phosphatase
VTARLAHAERLVLLLDFDGTLAPIVTEPARAALPARTRRALVALARDRATDLAIISGRALDDLRARVAIPGVDYAGCGGLELEVDGRRWVPSRAAAWRERTSRACARLHRALLGTRCRIENKGLSLAVHYRGGGVEDARAARAAVDRLGRGFQVTPGRRVFELAPAGHPGKRGAVDWFLRAFAGGGGEPVVAYAGDDVIDEPALRRVRALGGVTIHVGGRARTAAALRLRDPRALGTLLSRVAELRRRTTDRAALSPQGDVAP